MKNKSTRKSNKPLSGLIIQYFRLLLLGISYLILRRDEGNPYYGWFLIDPYNDGIKNGLKKQN